ncbi:MAG: hypothetical protein M0002_20755 [Rhodospirillales bacterium]|nr:hypothetical protein [Rhodospirillales bacterium]
MPICEADPWRRQYFAGVPCPPSVMIPTEDADCWSWYPHFRWLYDKIAVAHSQGLEAAPHGVMPRAFPVFSKPITNLRGMGIGSRVIPHAADYAASLTAGYMWMTLLEGEHVSTDVAVCGGRPVWWRHSTGHPGPGGTFDYWTIHAAPRPALEDACGTWAERHLAGYTGMLNLETIGGRIIEVHLRFADQWPDLYGAGWVAAVINLYCTATWRFADECREDGYSLALFGPHGRRYRHPPPEFLEAIRDLPGVSSVQITFHEDRPPETHAMPPGGFRVAIVNARSLDAGLAARSVLGRLLLDAADR